MITLIYDGDCPFCNNYISKQRLEATSGPVALINARSDDPRLLVYWQQGYPLDEGMLVDHDGTITFGAEALAYLASLTQPRSVFTAINKILKIRPIAHLLYPVFKLLRRIALFIRGIGPVRQPPIKEAMKHKAG